MSIFTKWVIMCDCDDCAADDCPAEYMGTIVDDPINSKRESRSETKWYAKQNGWGFRRVWIPGYLGYRGYREEISVCPECRNKALAEVNPNRFMREVVRTVEYAGLVLTVLSCGHEFTKLDPPAVNGTWECTACKLGWQKSGELNELPAEFRSKRARVKPSPPQAAPGH